VTTAPADKVPAVTRAVTLLRLLATHAEPVRAATLARSSGLPRSTVYQLLAALEASGLVVHVPEARGYGLGLGVFELGSAYLRHEPLERLARPVLLRLVESTGCTAHLGVLHGRETLYLLKEQPPDHLSVVTAVGVRLPASLTASGRAMLARLPGAQVRALFPDAAAFVDRTGSGPQSLSQLRWLLSDERHRGWAEEDGFVTDGVASVAAPVVDHDGHPLAAVGLTFASGGVDARHRARLASEAKQAADTISQRLSGRRL
jgi:DNA-binding IclR family transcriptional regulator